MNSSKEIPILNAFEFRDSFFVDSEQKKALHPPTNYFYISRIENFKDSMKFPLLPHRKTVFDFEFLTQGSTTRSKGLDKYTFGTNSFFFLPAYQISTHEAMSADARGFYCHFEFDLLQRNFVSHSIYEEFDFLKILGNPVIDVPQSAFSYIVQTLEKLEAEFLGSAKDKFDIIQINLLSLFIELRRYVVIEQPTKANAALRITHEYKNALNKYIYEKHLVAQYAELLSVSPNHLHKCVKAITGKSAHDLLDDMILLESKVLLKQSYLPIGEIAYKIGKQDPSDFGRFFKGKTGLTPSEYRNML